MVVEQGSRHHVIRVQLARPRRQMMNRVAVRKYRTLAITNEVEARAINITGHPPYELQILPVAALSERRPVTTFDSTLRLRGILRFRKPLKDWCTQVELNH